MATDFKPTHTQTRFGTFARAFKRDPTSQFERRIARTAVLYEDLRIELFGLKADPDTMPQLDAFGSEYRKLYFMRRAILTAVEFQQTVEHIARSVEFRRIEEHAREQNDPYYNTDWLPGLRFFASNRKLLKSIRKDVGGHFGEQATTNAFEIIAGEYVVRIELQYDTEKSCQVLMPFATEVAAAALLRKLPGSTNEEKSSTMIQLLIDIANHAIGMVQSWWQYTCGTVWDDADWTLWDASTVKSGGEKRQARAVGVEAEAGL